MIRNPVGDDPSTLDTTVSSGSNLCAVVRHAKTFQMRYGEVGLDLCSLSN
jgi:hypothetical protein